MVAAMLSERIRLLTMHRKMESAAVAAASLRKLASDSTTIQDQWSELQLYIDTGLAILIK